MIISTGTLCNSLLVGCVLGAAYPLLPSRSPTEPIPATIPTFSPPAPTLQPIAPQIAPEPPQAPIQEPQTRTIRAKVTACSPNDPKDRAYYRKHGYKGAKTNAVAADLRVLPKGTYLYVPGYADKFVPVDSPGGSVIRRSTAKGILQFDVKFKSFRQAKQWGVRWLDIEVLDKETTP
jgi:3D (Asp-Asp-Asp) domain-containing protein